MCPQDPFVEYFAGDTIAILPRNHAESIIQKLDYAKVANHPLTITLLPDSTKKKLPPYLPKEATTLRKLLRDCLDIRCVPKKLLIAALIPYTESLEEKRLLSLLCSEEGSALYCSVFIESKQNFSDLIDTLNTCRPPITVLLEHLPRLMPRPYTIASSPLSSTANQIRIIISIETDRSPPALVTNMLVTAAGITIQNSVISSDMPATGPAYHSIALYFRNTNQFRYTDNDVKAPTIMIANGTGVAPFLGFLEHRRRLRRTQTTTELGQCWLFYGHRYQTAMQPYLGKYFDAAKGDGILDELSLACSRDEQGNGVEHNVLGKYVQDAVYKCCKKFAAFFAKPNCKVFVCGGRNMAGDVESMISGMEDAKAVLNEKKDSGLYVVDVWT